MVKYNALEDRLVDAIGRRPRFGINENAHVTMITPPAAIFSTPAAEAITEMKSPVLSTWPTPSSRPSFASNGRWR